jgi:hypothetical protein
MAVEKCICGHAPDCHKIGPARKCEHCACVTYHVKGQA